VVAIIIQGLVGWDREDERWKEGDERREDARDCVAVPFLRRKFTGRRRCDEEFRCQSKAEPDQMACGLLAGFVSSLFPSLHLHGLSPFANFYEHWSNWSDRVHLFCENRLVKLENLKF
jgi:hypothetical protein